LKAKEIAKEKFSKIYYTIGSFLEFLMIIVIVPLIIIFIYIKDLKDKLNKRLYISLLPNGVKKISQKLKFVK